VQASAHSSGEENVSGALVLSIGMSVRCRERRTARWMMRARLGLEGRETAALSWSVVRRRVLAVKDSSPTM